MKYSVEKQIIIWIFSSILCVLMMGLAGCAQAVYHQITPSAAVKMMEESPDLILLDVRSESEFRKTRIEGAVLIPVSEIENRAKDELPNKDQVIVVYCRSGVRSENAARTLVKMGYTNVYDMGGIINWPYETVSG